MRSGAMGDVPDRAARIRALAERMYLADLSGLNGDGGHRPGHPDFLANVRKNAGYWFENAMALSDELDRLEAEEREKEADRG